MPFLLRKLHIAETHKIMLPLASTQGICPHHHHTGFFLSPLLIFKGTRRTNCLTNLKVRGILFSDVLIRLHIPGRWSATARTWPDVELPFRGRSRAAGFQRRTCRKPPGSRDLCNLKSARYTFHGVFHRLYQCFPIYN